MHEGPIYVHMHKSSSTTLSGNFAPNMFFSDEPGYYEDGNYGIRLETILRVIPAIEALTDNYGKYITFTLGLAKQDRWGLGAES